MTQVRLVEAFARDPYDVQQGFLYKSMSKLCSYADQAYQINEAKDAKHHSSARFDKVYFVLFMSAKSHHDIIGVLGSSGANFAAGVLRKKLDQSLEQHKPLCLCLPSAICSIQNFGGENKMNTLVV